VQRLKARRYFTLTLDFDDASKITRQLWRLETAIDATGNGRLKALPNAA